MKRFAALAATVLCFAMIHVVAPPAAAADAPKCAKLLFIGLRGSGEAADPSQQNMGAYIFGVYQSIAESAQNAGISVTPLGLDATAYPAVPVRSLLSDALITEAAPSVLQGTASLGGVLRPYIREDRTTCLVLAGYSQGAWVIGDYFWANPAIERRLLDRFTAVLLFGDPRFDADSDVTTGAAPRAAGVLRHQGPFVGSIQLPPSIQLPAHGQYYEGQSSIVRSYCVPEDPVCDFRSVDDESVRECAQEVPWCDHFGYGAGYLGDGINFVRERVLARASVPSDGQVLSAVPYSPSTDAQGLDLGRWCTSVGAGDVVHPPSVRMAGAVAAWKCSDGRPIDWAAACDQQYGPGKTRPVMFNPDDAYTAKCQNL